MLTTAYKHMMELQKNILNYLKKNKKTLKV